MIKSLYGLCMTGGLNDSLKGTAGIRRHAMYDEAVFRYLLENEHIRSMRTRCLHQILLVYGADDRGTMVRMTPQVSTVVIEALSKSIRETDYIGWYRNGYAVGAVLTAVEPDSMNDAANVLGGRLLDLLAGDLGLEASRQLHVRVCRHQELAWIKPNSDPACNEA